MSGKSANSEPQGPVYVHARREAMEQELDAAKFAKPSNMEEWGPIELGPLPTKVANDIVDTLLASDNALIVTSYVGRNPAAVPLLVKLAEALGVGTATVNASAVNFPPDHPLFYNSYGGMEVDKELREADAILIIDCQLPWIPMVNVPKEGCKIFHLDIDPLKSGMQSFYVAAK